MSTEASIPVEWIRSVLAILRHGRIGHEILITLRAQRDWEAATMGWTYELIEAIGGSLSRPAVAGKAVNTMEERGETYEFWIFHSGQRLYAKVCLMEGRIKVKVISAHRPLKGSEL